MNAFCNMADSANEFENWLYDKLKYLNTDEGVFSSYISGIVSGEDTLADKRYALEAILAEFLTESDIKGYVTDILDKWELCQPKSAPRQLAEVDVQLAKILESQTLATTTKKAYTDEEKKIREAILSQYSELSDGEEQQENSVEADSSNDLVKNTNASDMAAAARERREVAKQEAQRKKDKDKEDRDKQKQLKQEKKEKRKTQKGERKR